MDTRFHTFALLFLLFAATSCAPCPPGAWARVRNSSLELHQIARSESLKARNGSKDIYIPETQPAWIEAKDKCDPESLKENSETCLSKILSVSRTYSSALQMLSNFESCAAFAKKLLPALTQLQGDMGDMCVKLDDRSEVSSYENVAWWRQEPLCIHTLERLYSFSTLTARVFAVGNPAHHTAGPAHNCTL